MARIVLHISHINLMKNPQEPHGSEKNFSQMEGNLPLSTGTGPAPSGKEETLSDLSKPRFFLQKNRFTYTFFAEKEVASIHFDGVRGEIFYNGHNIRNMQSSESQVRWMRKLPLILQEQGCEKGLISRYEAALSKLLE